MAQTEDPAVVLLVEKHAEYIVNLEKVRSSVVSIVASLGVSIARSCEALTCFVEVGFVCGSRLLSMYMVWCAPQEKETFEFVATEHLRMSGVYWGITALALMDRLHELDQEEILGFVNKCQHPSGGFGGNIGHDAHLLYTLSAVSRENPCTFSYHRLDPEKPLLSDFLTYAGGILAAIKTAQSRI
eukprot:715659-Prorocentrum_minimum.AAC.1